ncbi:phospholipase B-like [Haematococcus lacustris]|uniref:Phospholipase B-like n=1 Tax=Haematococcus lacustris TaxID=44745 RepID=A0A699YS17_HAELA|nr:phospholipase B-like [Haematococcus lacustris]
MGHLTINTSAVFPDSEQLKAAGFLEGWLTAERIHQHFQNMVAFYETSNNENGPAQFQFLATQEVWLRHQMNSSDTQQSPFWAYIRLLMAQFDGLVQVGRRRHEPGSGLVTDWDSLSPRELAVELAAPGRCTAFVKVTPDFSDIFVAQAAWFTYAAMVRIFKHYHFKLHDTSLPGTDLAYSSYPGQLSSDDDFYLVNPTHLAVLQTTNRLFNESLLDTIQPQAVLSWQRVRSALSAASSGKEWAQLVGLHNSGTYTNSWLVIDLKRFSPGRPLQHGLLTVVEQVPDAMFSADFTHILESGYFALYNVPALQPAYEALGYPAFLASQHAMPAAGCYDGKVSSFAMALALEAEVVNGPTVTPDLPPFTWEGRWQNALLHLGQPQRFNFTWERMTPVAWP